MCTLISAREVSGEREGEKEGMGEGWQWRDAGQWGERLELWRRVGIRRRKVTEER